MGAASARTATVAPIEPALLEDERARADARGLTPRRCESLRDERARSPRCLRSWCCSARAATVTPIKREGLDAALLEELAGA